VVPPLLEIMSLEHNILTLNDVTDREPVPPTVIALHPD